MLTFILNPGVPGVVEPEPPPGVLMPCFRLRAERPIPNPNLLLRLWALPPGVAPPVLAPELPGTVRPGVCFFSLLLDLLSSETEIVLNGRGETSIGGGILRFLVEPVPAASGSGSGSAGVVVVVFSDDSSSLCVSSSLSSSFASACSCFASVEIEAEEAETVCFGSETTSASGVFGASSASPASSDTSLRPGSSFTGELFWLVAGLSFDSTSSPFSCCSGCFRGSSSSSFSSFPSPATTGFTRHGSSGSGSGSEDRGSGFSGFCARWSWFDLLLSASGFRCSFC
mmetsp:Transcript_6017/g.11048  ORF Transcript_6017/g.11048 Transcript_6017/m.11048 type:complete len:284 (-) Transcript_6017:1294-2145(-)